MTISTCDLEGVYIIEPKVFADSRGYFLESFNQQRYESQLSLSKNFIQDNESLSMKGVVRGLHFQVPPFAQAKLVRVIKGAVLDVVVDIRKNSPTYGQHFSLLLTEENKKQMYIPEGFAHGFATLEDHTIFSYKCNAYYNPSSEGCILWNDEELGIEWGVEKPIISAKDEIGQNFRTFNTPFV
ncbi:MAG: dTDP-4-dehydrorhamnose 3,5-epimerase [Crocinitomicaceae bacterium]|nr:dTDP-4-dehydrorhamnose 3,5-epimerase [Crocinitomicaceae bacterium]